MLPAAHRLRSAADFTLVTRRGRRVRCGSVVVYLLAEPGGNARTSRVGLVVGKAVGTSVVRHQVSRRLRAQLKDRLDRIPSGAKLVVRALPEASAAPSAELGRDLARALDKLTVPARHRPPHSGGPPGAGSSVAEAPQIMPGPSKGWSGPDR